MLSGYAKTGRALVASSMIASLMIVAGSAPLRAEELSTEALLRRFIAGANYQAAMLDAARQQAAELPGGCADVKFAGPQTRFTVVAPVLFEQQGGRDVLSKGAWVSHLIVDACGKSRQFNILFTASGPGRGGDFVSLLPGTTKASAQLQIDAAPTAMGAATMNSHAAPDTKACNSPAIVDTRFDASDAKPQPKAMPGQRPFAWHETWSVDLCGRQVDVRMDFTPDPTGTSIDAHIK